MIRVWHNELDGIVDPSFYPTLADLVSAYINQDAESPHLLLRLVVDGNEWRDEEIDRLSDTPLVGVEEVKLESRPARDVAISSLGHCADYSTAICRAIERCVDLFRTGEIGRANELCVDLADSLNVLAAAVASTISVLNDGDESMSAIVSKLNPWLEQLVEAQQAADWVRVSDYLEFEIAPAIGRWGRLIRSCQERVAPTSSASAHGFA